VKEIMSFALGLLLLTPGPVAAADRNPAQEPKPPLVATAAPLKLDLNVVSAEELLGVPGIGPHMAQAIVELRTKKGQFKNVEELLEVAGIKGKKLAAISKYLEVVPRAKPGTTTRSDPSR
jgi:competence protein ComEA